MKYLEHKISTTKMHEFTSEIKYADMLSSLQPGSYFEQPAK